MASLDLDPSPETMALETTLIIAGLAIGTVIGFAVVDDDELDRAWAGAKDWRAYKVSLAILACGFGGAYLAALGVEKL